MNVSADLILFGKTGNDNINFDEYIQCVKLLSTDGIKAIDNSMVLIKKLKSIDFANHVADEKETAPA